MSVDSSSRGERSDRIDEDAGVLSAGDPSEYLLLLRVRGRRFWDEAGIGLGVIPIFVAQSVRQFFIVSGDAVTSSSASGLVGSRTTKNGQYTDKFGFSFSTVGAGCQVKGCSQSQVTSIADFSTNYCNLHDLYCGSQDGCTPAGSDYAYSETDVDTSIGASSDKSACLGGSRKTFLRVGAAVAEA